MFILVALALLVILIGRFKVTPFLAFLITAIVAGLGLGMPAEKIPAALEKGVGSILGSMAVLIGLGAMFGKLVAESGAAQKIAMVLMRVFGARYIQWAVLLTGFVVGIPLFYNVGFVILVPLVFALVYQYKLPAIYVGLPMLTALSVTHGFLPPHPSPTTLIPMFGADMRTTLLYGLLVGIPTVIVAGPLLARTMRHIPSEPLATFRTATQPESELPGTWNSFLTALLPVLLLAATAALSGYANRHPAWAGTIALVSDPVVVLLFTLAVAMCTLGFLMGKTVVTIMEHCTDAMKDIAGLLFIMAGAGALKQVLTDSGISQQLALMMQGLSVHPLVLAWLVAALIRVCIGSATVAGVTAAGIMAPLAQSGQADPNLMVLAVGAGSLMLSHVNDSGFWLYKTYFNLTLKDTFRTWTLMETVVGVTGLLGIMILDWIL